ncbi:hypothetical protein MRB53_009895 [Persea americana]|uniref:Uncharacterized protein n=1 Tax=Persea americana TaxID=3435 RepID=A0ACC2LR23_PERAE|nr:hypothetical protein MRB53_009895 [Persea americana]
MATSSACLHCDFSGGEHNWTSIALFGSNRDGSVQVAFFGLLRRSDMGFFFSGLDRGTEFCSSGFLICNSGGVQLADRDPF